MLKLSVLAVIAVILILNEIVYRKTAYYQITKTPFLLVYLNRGKYGEYSTYKHLCYLEKTGAKFLFNLYIPKGPQETTEIDVLMITAAGLFVLESKNYSGWIFGDENQKKWYQTLPQGKGRSHKESFYNPIMQNNTHIKHLRMLLNEPVPLFSIIVFSDRCTLRSIRLNSGGIHVVNRRDVASAVAACNKASGQSLDQRRIAMIYDKLYPYTQVSAATKSQHITNIEAKLTAAPVEFSHQPLKSTPTASPTTETTPPSQNSSERTQPAPASGYLQCPKCGATLVLRTATRGSNIGRPFYGCSNFPKCKYIKSTEKNLP